MVLNAGWVVKREAGRRSDRAGCGAWVVTREAVFGGFIRKAGMQETFGWCSTRAWVVKCEANRAASARGATCRALQSESRSTESAERSSHVRSGSRHSAYLLTRSKQRPVLHPKQRPVPSA